MPLDGLRAWIGEVERKLGMRTRVFLVLTTIAIGGAGAAIYLAIDTRDNAVSESDVQELQEDLEAQVGAGGAVGGADVAQLEADLRALEAEVDRLRGGASKGEGATGASSSAGAGAGAGAAEAAGGIAPDGGTNDTAAESGGAATAGGGVPPGVPAGTKSNAE